MHGDRHDKVHIWPQLEHEADEPKAGWFAVKLGKHHPERALRVILSDGLWFAYLDGKQLATGSDIWKHAFGIITRNRTMLTGRILSEQDYKELLRRRTQDAAAGIDADKSINLNTARAPF